MAEELKGIVGDGDTLTSPEGLLCYSCDGTALREAIPKVARRIQETPWEREFQVVIFGRLSDGRLRPDIPSDQADLADHGAVVV